MNGIIIIDKPKDFTSFDVVAVMRKLSKQKKIGHTGTLDPMATGVLPLLLGNATKAQEILPKGNKEYVADFKFGITTDTLDITGTVLSKQSVTVTKQQLLNVLSLFRGDIMQQPPMYSAIQKNGKRLYELARKGIEIERDFRPVTIFELELLRYNCDSSEGTLKVSCSKGTYIRSLVNDIGNKLNCGAVLTALNRTAACGYTIQDAITLNTAKEFADQGILQEKLLPTETIFFNQDILTVSELQSIRFKNGGNLDIFRTDLKDTKENNKIIRVKSPTNEFLGLGITNIETNEICIYKIF